MVRYKLTYFNGRGRAEFIRQIFEVAGVEYEDIRIDVEKWPALKPNTPFGQIPILEFEGKTFSQSYAIGRYLARKFNLAGKTEVEQLQADMIIDCMEDAERPFTNWYEEKDEARKAQMLEKYSKEQLPISYAYLENILKSNKGGDGFFVGDDLTWVDLVFLCILDWEKFAGNEALLDKFPKLKALQKRVESVPKVAAWIAKRPVTDH